MFVFNVFNLDSDDLIENDTLEYAYNKIKEKPVVEVATEKVEENLQI